MDPRTPIPEDPTDLPWVSMGISGAIFAVSDAAVIKVPLPLENSKEQLAVERHIYERLGQHPYITKLLYIHNGMVVLERLQFPLRKHLLDLQGHQKLPPTPDVLRWASQITEAFQYMHSCGVFQVDIGPHNVLLDWERNAKLSDFAGSSLDGSEPLVGPSSHSEHPNMPATSPSILSELFALGSTLYEIETTNKPYASKTDQELEELFRADDFPATDGLALGSVISKCWMAQYKNANETLLDVKRIQHSHEKQRPDSVS